MLKGHSEASPGEVYSQKTELIWKGVGLPGWTDPLGANLDQVQSHVANGQLRAKLLVSLSRFPPVYGGASCMPRKSPRAVDLAG